MNYQYIDITTNIDPVLIGILIFLLIYFLIDYYKNKE
nr:MAG TPA: hypothetical protein [Caudoviricetes sp.]